MCESSTANNQGIIINKTGYKKGRKHDMIFTRIVLFSQTGLMFMTLNISCRKGFSKTIIVHTKSKEEKSKTITRRKNLDKNQYRKRIVKEYTICRLKKYHNYQMYLGTNWKSIKRYQT